MKNNLLNKFQHLMLGRNGGDHLSLALILISLILSMISRFSNLSIIAFLSYFPFILAMYRMFSKNINKRRLENYKFMMVISPMYSRYHKVINRFKNRKVYKFFKCPNCKQSLRVPKGKGRINIKCSKCGTKFMKKS